MENSIENLSENNTQSQVVIPFSKPSLICGILSIALCWCCGFPGVALGILGLVFSSLAIRRYNEKPEAYTLASYKNAKAAKTCALIGLIISAIWSIIFFILYVLLLIEGNGGGDIIEEFL
jgi:hypothetical protein